jgi:hypothetical protein
MDTAIWACDAVAIINITNANTSAQTDCKMCMGSRCLIFPRFPGVAIRPHKRSSLRNPRGAGLYLTSQCCVPFLLYFQLRDAIGYDCSYRLPVFALIFGANRTTHYFALSADQAS